MDTDSIVEDCLLLVQMSKLGSNDKRKLGVVICRARQTISGLELSEPNKATLLAALCNEIISLCSSQTSKSEFTSSISFLSNLLQTLGSTGIDTPIA